jgi:hypothetical protein
MAKEYNIQIGRLYIAELEDITAIIEMLMEIKKLYDILL